MTWSDVEKFISEWKDDSVVDTVREIGSGYTKTQNKSSLNIGISILSICYIARYILVILSPSFHVILNEVKNLLLVIRIEYTYVLIVALRINSAKNLLLVSH